jgi:hypothetical protein
MMIMTIMMKMIMITTGIKMMIGTVVKCTVLFIGACTVPGTAVKPHNTHS